MKANAEGTSEWSECLATETFFKAERVPTLQRANFKDEGRYPVIDQGKAFIAGYCDEYALVYHTSLPTIVFGDHTREWKYVNFPFVPGADGTQILLPKPNFDSKFLFYALFALPLPNLGYARHFKLLKEATVRFPNPRGEQRKIAAILSSVDDTIEKTQAVIDELQAVKKAMMQELLTRGIPGRHTRYKPLPAVWRLGRLRENPTEVPDGWELIKLTSVARLESGHTPSRRHPEYWEGSIPWVSLHDSKGLDIPEIHDTAQTIGQLGLANSSARLLPAGTVVFSRTATVGKACVMGREMATSQDFANYVCGPRIHNRYLMHLLRSMTSEWERLMAGSTHKTIYMPVFEELQVLLPPLEEQIRIARIGDSFEDRIARERTELAALRELKAGLLSHLLTGEIRVTPDPEPSP